MQLGSAMNNMDNKSRTRISRFNQLSANAKSIIVFSSVIVLIGLSAVALS
jgi:hypothetical protein